MFQNESFFYKDLKFSSVFFILFAIKAIPKSQETFAELFIGTLYGAGFILDLKEYIENKKNFGTKVFVFVKIKEYK